MLYIIANIALGAQNSYAGLLVLRCLQSSGISGTVALSNAAIADIITSAERGAYIGWASVGGALGPSLSLIIGGILSQYLGYHSVFWFLAILGGVFVILLLILFPETCRKVVGNGSIPPPKWSRSYLNYHNEKKRGNVGEAIDFSKRDELAKQRGLKIPNPIMATLVMVAELESGLLLLCMGLLYAGLYFILGLSASHPYLPKSTASTTSRSASSSSPRASAASSPLSRRESSWTGTTHGTPRNSTSPSPNPANRTLPISRSSAPASRSRS